MASAGMSKLAYRAHQLDKKVPTVNVGALKLPDEYKKDAEQLGEQIQLFKQEKYNELKNNKKYIAYQNEIDSLQVQINSIEMQNEENLDRSLKKANTEALKMLKGFRGFSVDQYNEMWLYDTQIGFINKQGELYFTPALKLNLDGQTKAYDRVQFNGLISQLKEDKNVKRYEKLLEQYQQTLKPSEDANKILDKIDNLIKSDTQNTIKQYCTLVMMANVPEKLSLRKYEIRQENARKLQSTLNAYTAQLSANIANQKRMVVMAESELSKQVFDKRIEFIKTHLNDLVKAINKKATIEKTTVKNKEKITIKGVTPKEFIAAYFSAESGKKEVDKQEIKEFAGYFKGQGFTFEELKKDKNNSNQHQA